MYPSCDVRHAFKYAAETLHNMHLLCSGCVQEHNGRVDRTPHLRRVHFSARATGLVKPALLSCANAAVVRRFELRPEHARSDALCLEAAIKAALGAEKKTQ